MGTHAARVALKRWKQNRRIGHTPKLRGSEIDPHAAAIPPLIPAALLGCIMVSSCQPSPPPAEVTVLVRGAAIRMANGLAFDADDQLYVASFLGREIVVVDPDGGDILDRIGPDRGLDSNDDLVFGPDGSLYWTGANQVGRRSSDGTVKVQYVAEGTNPITMSDTGRLFVGLDFNGDALFELDPELNAKPRLIAENFGSLNGMDWGPDGRIYGPSWNAAHTSRNRIVSFDVDSGEMRVVAEGLPRISAVKFDSRGRLHVTPSSLGARSEAPGEIFRLDLDTGERTIVAEGFQGIDSLAFDSRDRLFVSSNADGSIVEVLANGTTRTVVPAGSMIGAGGVAVVAKGDTDAVLVADSTSIKEFNGNSGELNAVHPGVATTVAAHNGQLVTSSWFSNLVELWDVATHELLASHADFDTPLNAIAFGDGIVVAELGAQFGSGRVVLLQGDRRRTLVSAEDGVQVPTGLVARGGDLWVSDWQDGELYQIAANGQPLETIRLVASDLAQPEGMALLPDGRLLIAETAAGRLTALDLDSGARSVVADGLHTGAGRQGRPAHPPTYLFTGVAVAASGTIYVNGDAANVLYRIDAS